MLPLLFSASLSTALAAPAGYTVSVAAYEGCELSLGPAMKDGVVPMHAECYWPDVTLSKFNAVFSDYHKHADVFGVVVESNVLRVEGNRSLVYQLQRSKGISDREVVQWMWHEVTDGADRYAWTSAADQPLELKSGNVRPSRSDGYWQAKADSRGGVTVVHHLEYEPGGSVPGFIVRWFQTSGLETNLSEAHASTK